MIFNIPLQVYEGFYGGYYCPQVRLPLFYNGNNLFMKKKVWIIVTRATILNRKLEGNEALLPS